MEGKQHRDDFDTFLMSVQKMSKGHKSETTTTRIMTALSRLGKTDVVKLMTMMSISWSEFTESVNSLREAGLIDMDEDNKTATVRLTKEGSRWAVAMAAPGDDEDI
jgi:Mn-dependent DtxR family transcriptional regulator